MHLPSPRHLFATVFAAIMLMLSSSGCTYLKYRGQDALDIMDVGVTFSPKAQFSCYASAPGAQFLTLGFGKVDGHFFGLGEGQATAWGPHYESSVGLLVWGEEMVSFHKTEAELAALPAQESDRTANFMRVGPAGFVDGPMPSLKYFGTCPHYLHLGWIGLVASPRWLQIADFLVGFTTLDLCQDDGDKRQVPGGCQLWQGVNPGERPSLIFTPVPEAAPAAAKPVPAVAPPAK